MPLLGRIFAGDEELGKKDDDHKLRKSYIRPLPRAFRHSMLAFRKRRLLYTIVSLVVLYFLFQNASSGLGFHSRRRSSWASGGDGASIYEAAPTGQPPRPRVSLKAEEHYFDGRIKFYNLAVSLHGIMGLGRHNRVNRNVLFAASDLRSASDIIPIACEMANRRKNNVHFALMGRDDLNVSDIKDLNGISDEHCTISWHDARPDYSRWSSDVRMEVSVAAALGHIQTYLEPQVIITGHASREDGFFTKAVRAKALEIGKSLIELPLDAIENLMWVTRLDSGSLAAWQTVYVDLVIHAPPKSSGSLIRLLKSIEAADYFGSRRPHLTIELPAEIDRPTLDFLENLVWPPLDGSGAPHASQVTLRHRVPRNRYTAEEASTHFIESFYPARPRDSHVLLISPQAELSSIYYHYVMYHLLQYKYSTYLRLNEDSKYLMGFSLELPTAYLNNSAELEPPVLEGSPNKKGEVKSGGHTPFLWQAPNSNAALYFGDKWVELHSFLSARISVRDPHAGSDYKPPSRQKIVSGHYPSWMEYVQELMRVRDYFLLYPYFPPKSEAVVTIHNELHQLPEEYSRTRYGTSPTLMPSVDPYDPFTVDPSTDTPSFAPRQEPSLRNSNLLSFLSEFGHSDLSELGSLPILSHDGNLVSSYRSAKNAQNFATEFRREIGRCSGNIVVVYNYMSAEDLFCDPDQHEGLHIDPVEEKHMMSNEESITAEEIIGSPVNSLSKHGEKNAKTLINDGEDVQNEFAAHLGRQNTKLTDDADMSLKLKNDKSGTEVIKQRPEKGDHMLAGVINQAPMKQDPARDLASPGSQAVLESPTESITTPDSPLLSVTADAEPSNIQADFVPPMIRHPGW